VALHFLSEWTHLDNMALEHVSDTRRCQDELRLARHWLDLLAKMANVRLHQIVVTRFAESPDMHHDLIERADIVGVRRKQVQQSAFRRRQTNHFAFTHDLVPDSIHTKWTDVNDC